MDGMLFRSVFLYITYISIIGDNHEKSLYTGPGQFVRGIPVTEDGGRFMHPLEHLEPE